MSRRAPDAAAARQRLLTHLYTCSPVILAAHTVDDLVAEYRVDPRVAEYEMTIARQKRGATS